MFASRVPCCALRLQQTLKDAVKQRRARVRLSNLEDVKGCSVKVVVPFVAASTYQQQRPALLRCCLLVSCTNARKCRYFVVCASSSCSDRAIVSLVRTVRNWLATLASTCMAGALRTFFTAAAMPASPPAFKISCAASDFPRRDFFMTFHDELKDEWSEEERGAV